jgi:hypothetical protein
VRRLALFIGVEPTDELITKRMVGSSFDTMKEQSSQQGGLPAPEKGVVGDEHHFSL